MGGMKHVDLVKPWLLRSSGDLSGAFARGGRVDIVRYLNLEVWGCSSSVFQVDAAFCVPSVCG